MEWVEKASFDRLNKLFEIAANERNCQTLLSAQNLRSVTQVSQPYVLNILPRRLPKKVVSDEHFVHKDLPFYLEAREADAQARQERLSQREEKRQEGTLRKAPGDKRPTPFPQASSPAAKKKKIPTKGIVIRSSVPSSSSASSSESGLPERIPGQFGSGPSMPATERLALAAGEEASVDQPGFPHPDEGGTELVVAMPEPTSEIVEVFCPNPEPISTTPMEEAKVEGQGLHPCESNALALVPVKGVATRRSRPPRDLTVGIIGWLQDVLHETIEVSCSSVREDPPEGHQAEIVKEDPFTPMLILDEESPGDVRSVMEVEGPAPGEEQCNDDPTEGGSPDDVGRVAGNPFSYAELGEMLKQIPSGSEVELPSSRMFDMAKTVYLLNFSIILMYFCVVGCFEFVAVGFSAAGGWHSRHGSTA